MKALLDRARSFKRRVDFESDEYRKLVVGQFPDALFITCSDSRVIPALITGARPGEIFELRNAGNIVPPHDGHTAASGEAATIEYALEVLGVQDVVVCGHSHCGAMGAITHGADLSGLPRVDAWLDHARPGLQPVLSGARTDDPALREVVQLNVRNQLDVLGGYPAVVRLTGEKRLRLHGWYYEIGTGAVHELDEDGRFRVHGS
ncbi:carbonic anhydrase [Streptomyces sp. NPDC059861]|uniref:carbonic anhydrase n=1 Tax=Streptomyces sp. NPDC059861 TaxID=3346974 RepID=UPI003669B785